MKKIIGAILVLIIAAAFIYMISQNKSSDKMNATETFMEKSETAGKENMASAPEIDEKALALEEMKMNAGKSGLSKQYIVKCSACHGRDGKGPIGPVIAGKDSAYNYAALLKYKKGEVPNTMMKGLLENTSEAELKTLADEIASFK